MKLLKLHQNIINEFRDENKLNRSEFGIGALYWLEDDEQKLVDDFEKTHKVLITNFKSTKTGQNYQYKITK